MGWEVFKTLYYKGVGIDILVLRRFGIAVGPPIFSPESSEDFRELLMELV